MKNNIISDDDHNNKRNRLEALIVDSSNYSVAIKSLVIAQLGNSCIICGDETELHASSLDVLVQLQPVDYQKCTNRHTVHKVDK